MDKRTEISEQATDELNNVAMWTLIGVFMSAVVVMTVAGMIQWAPKQAYIPQQASPVALEDIRQAVETGGLRRGN